jgi:hypothetical protein
MDENLKETLETIQAMRAAIWLAFDKGGTEDADKNMPEDLRKEFYDAAKVLAKNNYPDDMMDTDMQSMLGPDA